MPRPSKCRHVCVAPEHPTFVPENAICTERTVLTVDEYECLRLIDLEKLTHAQCAERMSISRTTVTEIYESAREKIACALVYGNVLSIEGGNYLLYGDANSTKNNDVLPMKGETTMRIAVTYNNGEVFQHFGHSEQFKIYDCENGAVVDSQVVDTNGSGHDALSGFLKSYSVDALICGGIGGGARNALAAVGIALYPGVTGNADESVNAFLAGTLNYNPNTVCAHHDHNHGEGHTCGSHCGGHHHE